jgi:GTP-binding protein
MKPIIAIVGRPNVGKSTLFNRIAGERKAIVWDEPGVTRDRNYADGEWSGRPFTLIDTGGFDPDSTDEIFTEMRAQVRLAMDEAKVILFVLDGKEGLTPTDVEIADLLRRQEKPVFAVVNKVDGPRHEEKALEFYRLGFDPLYSLSAEHGYGVSELLDAVAPLLPETSEEVPDEDVVRVAVIGRPNVGKSSLINRFLGYERVIVNETPGTTRDSIDTAFERKGRKYVLVDTAGIRRKSRISLQLEKFSIVQALQTVDRCDVALLMIDPVEEVTEQDSKIGGFIHEKGKGCIIVVNKWDLVEKETNTMKEYEARVREELKYLAYAPILFISVKSGQRLPKVLDTVDRVAEQGNRKISTGELNRHLGRWVEAVHPPLFNNRPVKLNYITQVGTRPPTFAIFTNFPRGIHFSYQRYLVNQMREVYGFEGVPVRLQFRRKGKER